jgi:hypothetical protein
MSYCRSPSEGDVYMFGSGTKDKTWIECCGCMLTGTTSFLIHSNDRDYDLMIQQAKALGRPYTEGEPYDAGSAHRSLMFDSPEEALEHLLEHQEAGHEVPETALERLRAEIRGEEYVYPLDPEEVREELLYLCHTYAVIPFPKPLSPEAPREWSPGIHHLHSVELEEELSALFTEEEMIRLLTGCGKT